MIRAHNITLLYLCICFGIFIVALTGVGGDVLGNMATNWSSMEGNVFALDVVALTAGIAAALAVSFLSARSGAGAALGVYSLVFVTLWGMANAVMLSIPNPTVTIFVYFFMFIGIISFIYEAITFGRGA